MKRTPLLSLGLAPLLLAWSQEARPDSGKRALELPIEIGLQASSPLAPSLNESAVPGLVSWHSDFATAREAAKRSGKPVLLFQLLGRLDEALC